MALPDHIGDLLEAFEVRFDDVPLKPLSRAEGGRAMHENHLSVGLKALPSNGQAVYVGSQSAQPWPLAPGETLTINITKQNTVWLRGTSGDGVAVIAVRTTGERRRSAGA